MSKELEALEQLKAINKYDGGKYHTLGHEKEIKVVEKGLKALEVLSNHKLLNLDLLDEYDVSEYEEYYENTSRTTNELNYDEFVILKEWQDSK